MSKQHHPHPPYWLNGCDRNDRNRDVLQGRSSPHLFVRAPESVALVTAVPKQVPTISNGLGPCECGAIRQRTPSDREPGSGFTQAFLSRPLRRHHPQRVNWEPPSGTSRTVTHPGTSSDYSAAACDLAGRMLARPCPISQPAVTNRNRSPSSGSSRTVSSRPCPGWSRKHAC